MNAIIPANFGQVSAKFAAVQTDDDLSAGVQSGYGVIGYKGKVWSIRHRGSNEPLMRDDGDGPRNSIEVVLLKASRHVSKIWYENGYEEGSTSPPDCFSTNGVTPDVGATKKQSPACAACQRNAWGSRITPQGKQGKECSDSKRVAIVPATDISNEAFGGPMLLRIPAASLRELASYGEKMQALGYPYSSVVTRVSFDAKEAYPKFVFGAVRPLSDAEADMVVRMRDEPAVARVLAEGTEMMAAPAVTKQEALTQAFEQPPQVASAPKAEAPKVEVKPAVKPEVKPEAKAEAAVDVADAPATAFEEDLDAALDKLLG